MLVLAVESATDGAGVALADEGGALGSLVVARGRRHTETITPAIDALCRRVGVTLAEIDLVAVDVGPGLFTGLRVGVGTAQAIAFALDIGVVTATSLEVLAHAVVGSASAHGRLVVPVVDARRGEVFSGLFRAEAGSAVATTAAALGPPHALAEMLAALTEPVVAAGDGALRYATLFTGLPGVILAGAAYASPPVTALAELAVARGLAGLVGDAGSVTPQYMRQADARINWEQRVAPRAPTVTGG